jgi:segregation and condensation protein B
MTKVNTELRNIIEAALLVAGVPLTVDKLISLFPEESRPSRDEVRAALDRIERECEGRGIELKKIDQGWRFQTRQKYAEWIARLSEERPVRYSRALLETLAIIAYRQPVTRGEIEDIRGVAVSTEIIKTLVGREWIREVGRRDVPGRPALYGTTRGFLEHFNLRGLDELPPLAELRDVDKIAAELNLRLPVGETPAGGASDTPDAEAQGEDPLPAEASAEDRAPLEAAPADGAPAVKL